MAEREEPMSSDTEDEDDIGPVWMSEGEDGAGFLWTPSEGEASAGPPPDRRPGRPGRVSCYRLAVRPYRYLSQHRSQALDLLRLLDLEALAAAPVAELPSVCRHRAVSSWGAAALRPCRVSGQDPAVQALAERWTERGLLERHGDVRFSIKRKPFDWGPFEVDGRLQLKYFLRLCRASSRADWPLYLFEPNFDEDGREALLAEWADAVPQCFREPNALACAPEAHRPPGRYFLVGGKRSGSYVHLDPCQSSAWNLLLHGRKRWALLPPSVPRHIVEPLLFTGDLEQRLMNRCPAAWFHFVLPRLREMQLGLLEFTQHPGETVFVPRGWWHAVLNLDDYCVCATENFVAPVMVAPALGAFASEGSPEVAEEWRSALLAQGWCRGEADESWRPPSGSLVECAA